MKKMLALAALFACSTSSAGAQSRQRARPSPRTSRRFSTRTARPVIGPARSPRCRSSPTATRGRMRASSRRRCAGHDAAVACRPRASVSSSTTAGSRAAEKDTILRWVSAGAPEGNKADLPRRRCIPDGWNIGKPDAVFTMTEDYPVPASGTIDYKHFEVPTNFTEDQWIQAYEVKPGTPRVVHHVIVYARRAASAPRRRQPAARRHRPTAAPRPPRRQRAVRLRAGMDEPAGGPGRGGAQAQRPTIGRRPPAASARSSARSRPARPSASTRRARR